MIAVLGVDGGALPAESAELLARATLVAGGTSAPRGARPGGRRATRAHGRLEPRSTRSAAHEGDACVLASGDPGFYGIVRALAARVGADRLDVRPAPSSVAVAFARLGLAWDDALVVSGHGRDPHAALAAALRHPKVAILTAPAAPPAWYAERLAGSGRTLAVAERLGEGDERVVRGAPEEIARATFAEPNVLLVFDPAPAGNGRARVWPPRTPPGGPCPTTPSSTAPAW